MSGTSEVEFSFHICLHSFTFAVTYLLCYLLLCKWNPRACIVAVNWYIDYSRFIPAALLKIIAVHHLVSRPFICVIAYFLIRYSLKNAVSIYTLLLHSTFVSLTGLFLHQAAAQVNFTEQAYLNISHETSRKCKSTMPFGFILIISASFGVWYCSEEHHLSA